MNRLPMASKWEPYDDEPWLKHTRGSRARLIAAHAIAFVVVLFFLLLVSLPGN